MTVSSVVCSALLGAAIIYNIYSSIKIYLKQSKVKRENGCLPPSKCPQMDPWLGIDIVLSNLRAAKKFGFLALLRSRHEKYGPTFTTRTFFRTTFNTCDPRVLQCVLATQFQDFGMGPLRRKSASPLLGRGIFTQDAKGWEHQRALIRPSFMRAQIIDFSIYESHVDSLISLLPKDGSVIDLQKMFFRMVLDSNTEYLFGESVGLLSPDASESANAFHRALDVAQQGTILRLRLGNAMVLHHDQKYKDACKTVHAFADKFVARALDYRNGLIKAPEKADDATRRKYIFLNELAQDTQDPQMLSDQIVNMLLAARDTTAGLLSFVFFMLVRRPDVWEKLRTEVTEGWEEPMTYESLQKFTYLRYVLQESKLSNLLAFVISV